MPRPRPKYTVTLNETQAAPLRKLSHSYTAPFGEVQRARIRLLIHQQPDWQNHRMAQTVGCCMATVQVWRRWSGEKLAVVATEQRIVPAISASTIRR